MRYGEDLISFYCTNYCVVTQHGRNSSFILFELLIVSNELKCCPQIWYSMCISPNGIAVIGYSLHRPKAEGISKM